MEFRLLGPLEVEEEGKVIPLGGAKQRALLALLLLDRGRAVSTDRLVDEIWAGAPPQTAAKSIQVYVSGLRKLLGEGRIVTRERGYELRVESGETDVDRFDELVRTASEAPPGEAAVLLQDALALVRGRPLEDVSLEPWAAAEATRLEERILAATEARIDADLALGRHRELHPRARAFVAEHPFREGFLEQLMLALYRSGRQADALEAYRRGASRLRDELGLEPGRRLRDLEAAVLRHDPELELEAPPDRPPADALPAPPPGVDAGGCRSDRGRAGRNGGDCGRRDAWRRFARIAAAGGGAARCRDRSSASAHLEKEIAQPVEVVAGAGNLWVWNLQPHSLVRIDPANGEITASVGSPFGGDAGWYLPDGDDVWFAGLHDLARVNVEQGQEVDRFHLTDAEGRFGLTSVARCAGSLCIPTTTRASSLFDPETGAVQARVHTIFPWPVACGDGGIWVGSNPAGLRRIDPRTNTIVATAHTQDQYVSIAVGGGYAWTADKTKGVGLQGRPERSDRRDLRGRRRPTGRVLREWSALGLDTDAGTVTGIDATSRRHADVPVRHPLRSVDALEDALLVELADGLTSEDRIDSLQGDVAKVIVPIYTFDPRTRRSAWTGRCSCRARDVLDAARPTERNRRLAQAGPRIRATADLGRRQDVHVRCPLRRPVRAAIECDRDRRGGSPLRGAGPVFGARRPLTRHRRPGRPRRCGCLQRGSRSTRQRHPRAGFDDLLQADASGARLRRANLAAVFLHRSDGYADRPRWRSADRAAERGAVLRGRARERRVHDPEAESELRRP